MPSDFPYEPGQKALRLTEQDRATRRQFLLRVALFGAGIVGAKSVAAQLLTDPELAYRVAGEMLDDPLVREALTDELRLTPHLTEGPFFPYRYMPLDKDNDLVRLGDSTIDALGEILNLRGKVLTKNGEPVPNAEVHLWQTDSRGAYLVPSSSNFQNRDSNFQGYGRFETDSKGEYRFRTIRPVPYANRTPHIHIAVDRKGHRRLATQIIDRDHRMTARDGVLRSVRDPELRELVLRSFKPSENSKLGEIEVIFDIVVGATPEI
ncbi:MAG: intradiol ring-cleavage dioxygenase [Armatimonadetes bacterium]|nr:intradiol ring-cleavage dioxygenase [Armatimonadota bacterium]